MKNVWYEIPKKFHDNPPKYKNVLSIKTYLLRLVHFTLSCLFLVSLGST